jgi:hypothetical protein
MIIEAPPGWLALQPACDDTGTSISPGREPDPFEIDPRPCGWCCLTVDRHRRVDTPEGPEFFCPDLAPDEMSLDELERRAELRRQEEVAAIFARLEAMDDPSRRLPAVAQRYRTPQSTIEAFKFVVSLGEPDRLEAWLLNHPQDAPTLLKLLETT